MSAFGGKADMTLCAANVRFWPKADILTISDDLAEELSGCYDVGMRRRSFIAGIIGSAVISPLAARAQQQAGKVPRIGYLGVTSPSDRPPLLDAFRQGLRELGWVEGQNIVIDYRFAEGRLDRLPDLAAELVRLKVDIIVSAGTQGVTAATNATETIPIVMIGVRDPVGTGLIASLARPGGNVTGVSGSAGLEKSSPNSSSCSRRPSPRPTVWPSSRTRPMRTTSSR
jgi:hypothetical protein